MEQKSKIIKVAVLAEEPLFWASGKHFFPVILDGYSWIKDNITYTIDAKSIYDKDILRGDLNKLSYDVLLLPGGGVGDGEVITKGVKITTKETFEIEGNFVNKFHTTRVAIVKKFSNEKLRSDVNNGNSLGPVKCVSEKSASGKRFSSLPLERLS